MSYLNDARIAFRGRFLSDVSTNNNIPQNYAPGAPQRTLWNTLGGASFDLLDCAALISGAVDQDDPVANCVVTGAVDRPSGKMVDVDPEWQMASELWGVRLRIADRGTGAVMLEGKVAVCAFRDLWARQLSAPVNGQQLGARFVSVLEGLTWGEGADASPALRALQEETDADKLCIGLHTFGYFYNQQHPKYRTGSAMLHIGPWKTGEPDTALVHRRLNGATVQQTGQQPAAGTFDVTGDIDFALTDDGRRLHLDLGHALRLADVEGWLLGYRYMPEPARGIVRLSIGLLPAGPVDTSTAVQFLDIPIPDSGWYRRTGGVLSVDIPTAHAAAAENTPFALFAQLPDGRLVVMARETEDGIFYRSDSFVRRLETGATAEVSLHARQFGRPLAGLQLHVAPNPSRIPGPLPTLITPAPTDANGVTTLSMTGVDPGDPRAALALDGAVFNFGYGHKLQPNGQADLAGTGLGGLDVIVVHARDPYPVPDTPSFTEHIFPIMSQYAQLYPIMSEHLFDLSDYTALVANRRALLLAFGRSIEDPNYMPVTRDLSDGRLETIVKWLSTETGDPDEPLVRGAAPGPGPLAAAIAAAPADESEAFDMKSLAAQAQTTAPHRTIVLAELLEV